MLMQDEVLRGFARTHQLGDEATQRLTSSVLCLLRELSGSSRTDLPGLLARLLVAKVSDGATLAVEAPTAARRPSTRDTVAMDASPAMGVTASALEGTSRLQRLLSPNGGVESRYEDLGFLGQGGMGEVRRVRDHDLGRTLAMKIIAEPFKDLASAQTKFIEEARICAGLQHPGIVPLYELGRLPDGRFYFTMQEIEGHNFGVHIAQYHAPARA